MRLRRKHAEEIIAWKKKLDDEELQVREIERKGKLRNVLPAISFKQWINEFTLEASQLITTQKTTEQPKQKETAKAKELAPQKSAKSLKSDQDIEDEVKTETLTYVPH